MGLQNFLAVAYFYFVVYKDLILYVEKIENRPFHVLELSPNQHSIRTNYNLILGIIYNMEIINIS